MRTLNMLMGGLFFLAGLFMIFNGGITFLSVAFVIGLLFMVAGITECISYNSYRGIEEDNKWVLIDGLVMFLLGFLIIFNKLSADATVPLVLGLWVMTTGVRNLARAWEKFEHKNTHFYGHAVVGGLNLLVGLYMYFNESLFGISVAALVGVCLITQGLNIIMAAGTIIVVKHQKIMTKDELLEQAIVEADAAREAAREAVKMAKEAKANVAVIEETPEEELDLALAPHPLANILTPAEEQTEAEVTEETNTEAVVKKAAEAEASVKVEEPKEAEADVKVEEPKEAEADVKVEEPKA